MVIATSLHKKEGQKMNEKEELNRNTYRTQAIKRNSTKKQENRKRIIILSTLSIIILVIVIVLIVVIRSSNWSRSKLPQGNNDIVTNSASETSSLPDIYKGNEIIGTWRYDEYNQYTFNSDGTGFLMADNVRYVYVFELSDDKLILDFNKEIVKDCEYKYQVNGEELKLIGGSGTDGGEYYLEKEEEKG